ncbi:glucosamine-6-phosphate deaminase [Neobacillus sp. Marseille-QA0830]
MKLMEVRDYQHMSSTAAQYIIDKVRHNPKLRLGLATGGTPVGTYKNLTSDYQRNGTSYREVVSFNLDEYIGLTGDHPNSYRYYMNEALFKHIDIDLSNTHIPNGNAKDFAAECARYEKLIEDHGGVDLQILGIGGNGHIGFNEPGTAFSSNTHIVSLAPSTIKANARYFKDAEEVPTQAITMGIATIMKSKEILLLVSGEQKKQALANLLNGVVTEDFPASVLKLHPNVTIIADQAAVSSERQQKGV